MNTCQSKANMVSLPPAHPTLALPDFPAAKVRMTPKRLGEWVELQFCARAAGLGFAVLTPWGDSCRYDVVVGDGRKLSRVQVRGTSYRDGKAYSCSTRCGNAPPFKRFTAEEIDYFAGYIIPENAWFIMPVEVVARRGGTITLSPRPGTKYHGYLENWDVLREWK